MIPPLLELDHLNISLVSRGSPARRLVSDVSFSVTPGKVVALVGESGSGKTMIARSIIGLLPPPVGLDGSMLFGGRQLIGLAPREIRKLRGREIGMIFQEPMTSLNPSLTVGDQIGEALEIHDGCSSTEARLRALEMLAAVRISDPERTYRSYPHEFSGGMRQRIMIASVLALRPKLLIADEPTTALDALVQHEVMDLLLNLARDAQTAILLISHDLGLVAEHADNLVVLRRGAIVESGTPEQIMFAPRHEYTRSLLDSLPKRAVSSIKNAPPILEVEKLGVSFLGRNKLFEKRKTIPAVRDVSLVLRRGETLAIVGESGSGKTTLGRTILGLNPGAQGEVRFDGHLLDLVGCTRSRMFRTRTAMIFQDPGGSLDPRMRLGDLVEEPLRLTPGLCKAQRQTLAERALQDVGLDVDYATRFPHELSGGQRQRVAIARAIVSQPDLVVADEPVSALDPTVQHQVLEIFSNLQAKHGFASLFISHDLAVVEQIADRVAVMYHGRLLEIGPRDAVFDRPHHPYTIRLLEASRRVVREGAEGRFALSASEYGRPASPPDFAWATDTDPSATMVEVGPSHFVACTQQGEHNDRHH